MAFDAKNLVLMAHGNNRRWWDYTTTDTPATVDTTGYFNAAANMLGIGDLIRVTQVDNVAAPTSVTASGLHLVLSNDGITVDVSDATAIATSDLD